MDNLLLDALMDSSDSDDDVIDILLAKKFSAIKKRKRILESIPNDKFLLYFRFKREEIDRLLRCLIFPETFLAINGSKSIGSDVLLIVLRRLSYPNRLVDITYIFGRSKSEISLFFNLGNHLLC